MPSIPTSFKESGRMLSKPYGRPKVHTAWLKPDTDYEGAYVSFVEGILARSQSNGFLEDLIPFCRRVSHYGMLNSLSQTLIKIASPGVPDFYQGTELWDLSLVDPDNRRPVDLKKGVPCLPVSERRTIKDRPAAPGSALHERGWKDQALSRLSGAQGQESTPGDLTVGAYLPLKSAGRFGSHVIAFARIHERQWAVVIAPRFLSHLVQESDFPLGRPVWQDTEVLMPEGAPVAGGTLSRARLFLRDRHCLSEMHCSVFQWRSSWARGRRSLRTGGSPGKVYSFRLRFFFF